MSFSTQQLKRIFEAAPLFTHVQRYEHFRTERTSQKDFTYPVNHTYENFLYAVVVCLSMCLCVCVSVILRYCIKTAKRRIMQIMPHYGSATLVYTDKRVAQSLCHSRATCT